MSGATTPTSPPAICAPPFPAFALHCGTAVRQTFIIIAVHSEQFSQRRLRSVKAEFVDGELDLLNRVIDVIVDFDPDIISGWEVQAASWGYLGARGRSYGRFRFACRS